MQKNTLHIATNNWNWRLSSSSCFGQFFAGPQNPSKLTFDADKRMTGCKQTILDCYSHENDRKKIPENDFLGPDQQTAARTCMSLCDFHVPNTLSCQSKKYKQYKYRHHHPHPHPQHHPDHPDHPYHTTVLESIEISCIEISQGISATFTSRCLILPNWNRVSTRHLMLTSHLKPIRHTVGLNRTVQRDTLLFWSLYSAPACEATC